MRKYLKRIAVLVGIIGYGGGLLYSMETTHYLESTTLTVILYFVYCVITSLVIILLLSFEEHLSNQEMIYGLLYKLVTRKEMEKVRAIKPETKPVINETIDVPEHIWLCPKCGVRNHKSFIACGNCNTLRSEENK